MTESMETSLEKFLCREFNDGAQEKETFVIDTMEKANWAIKKILRCQSKNNDIDQLAETQINKIQQWQAQENEGNYKSIDYLTSLLEPYAKSQLSGKGKTVKLPSGSVSFRSVSPGYFIAGNKIDGKNQRLLDHVRHSDPEYLKIEQSVDWTKFKETLTPLSTGQVLTTDGEILDFISAVEYRDSVTVKERK